MHGIKSKSDAVIDDNQNVINQESIKAPTMDQLIGTLRLCVKHFNDNDPLFKRMVTALERINFVPLLSNGQLDQKELQRLVPMIANQLRTLRLQMHDIVDLFILCQALNVKSMPLLKSCMVLSSRNGNDVNYLNMLGVLLPDLEMLHIFAPIREHFPVLKKLRTLHLSHGINKDALIQLFPNCLQLEHFVLRDERLKSTSCYLNITGIEKCQNLRELVLPLYLQSSLSLCKLSNLTKLSLQHQLPWTDQHWLSVVTPIICAKRHELQCLTLDGAYLKVPLNLFELQLLQCTALTELRLSNCKLADSLVTTLPLSCQHLSFRRCTLGKLHCHLKAHALMHLVELFDCELLTDDGPSRHVLQTVICLRKCQPTLNPIQVQYSQTINLRKEVESWHINQQLENMQWMQIREVKPQDTKFWQQPSGTITMLFGQPVNYMPDMQDTQKQQWLNRITAADLIKDIDKSVIG